MHFTEPKNENFVYNRRFAPLYFSKPNKTERELCDGHMVQVGREYYRMCREYNIKEDVVLSNGMTAGEYCMWVILTNHTKRANSSY